jgi:hypothetical protein
MSIRARHIALSLLLALPAGAISTLHAQSSGNLQQRMSSDEFKAAGLDKLSPQELQNLDSWLDQHAKTTTKVVNSAGKVVYYPGDQKRTTIHTQIRGHFDGWSKDQVFTMANGQQWKSIDGEPHSCTPGENTEVQIKPSLLHTWMMYVPSCYENLHVKRVR